MSEEFLSWHKEFVKRYSKPPYGYGDFYFREYGILPTYAPNMPEWLEKVEKNHEQIRAKIGGISKTIKIEVDTNEVPSNIVYGIFGPLNSYRFVYDYFREYGLSYEDFQISKLAKLKGVGAAKHILGSAKRKKLPEEEIKVIEKQMERLGQMWAQYANAKQVGYATITTDPKAFCLTGHLKLDNDSCFQQGNFNSDKKYALGAHPNSFIVLLHREAKAEIKEKSNDFYARSQGLLTGPNFEIFNVFNHYPRCSSQMNELGIPAQMEFLAKNVLGVEKVSVAKDLLSLTKGINYGEGTYQSFSYFTPDVALKEMQNIPIDTKYSKESHEKRDPYAEY